MTPLNIALLGFGSIAEQVHFPNLNQIESARIIAVADTNQQRLECAKRMQPDIFADADFHRTIERPEVDAVLISLSSGLHAEAALAAIKAQKPFYLEKPLAINRADAEKVLLAHHANPIPAMMGFNFRFNPLFVDLKRRLQQNEIGRVHAVQSVNSASTLSMPAWKEKRKSGGGVLFDLAVHHFDMAAFLFDSPIKSTFAHMQSRHSEDDHADVSFTLQNGVNWQSHFSLREAAQDSYMVYGEHGQFSVDRYHSFYVQYHGDHPKTSALDRGIRFIKSLTDKRRRFPTFEISYQRALQHFVDCAQSGEMPSPTLDTGSASLSAILATEKSAACGQEVLVQPIR